MMPLHHQAYSSYCYAVFLISVQLCLFLSTTSLIVSVNTAYQEMIHSGLVGGLGVGILVISCISLRIWMYLYPSPCPSPPSPLWSILLFFMILYTAGVSIVGGQIAAWLIALDDEDEWALHRGQFAIYLACSTMLLSFIGCMHGKQIITPGKRMREKTGQRGFKTL